jgi:N-acetylneuraminic acid mutarotase
MNKSLYLFLVLISMMSLFISNISAIKAAENTWVSKAPMHSERYGLGVAVANGKIYAIGGYVTNVNEEYDPTTNIWTNRKPLPNPRGSFAIAVYQNKIYVMGGTSSEIDATGVNEVYDPATETWETKAPMPTPRAQLAANVVNGKIYLIGGLANPFSSPNVSGLTEVYDPATNTWTTKASIPTPVFSYASAVVGDKIYVISENLNQIYDSVTDKWTLGKPLPTPVTDAAAGATIGVWAPKRIYVTGGRTDYSLDGTNINQVYDPESDTWSTGAPMPTARFNHAIAVVRDMLYAIGGQPYAFMTSPDSNSENEQYTPIGYGTIPIDTTMPSVLVLSPENRTYDTTTISLNFTVSETVSWIHYCIDAQDNVTIAGNTTLTGLSYGFHNLTVYAIDTAENTGVSETIYFSINRKTEPQPEPFPITFVVAVIVSIAVVAVGFLVYFKKVKKTRLKTE